MIVIIFCCIPTYLPIISILPTYLHCFIVWGCYFVGSFWFQHFAKSLDCYLVSCDGCFEGLLTEMHHVLQMMHFAAAFIFFEVDIEFFKLNKTTKNNNQDLSSNDFDYWLNVKCMIWFWWIIIKQRAHFNSAKYFSRIWFYLFISYI